MARWMPRWAMLLVWAVVLLGTTGVGLLLAADSQANVFGDKATWRKEGDYTITTLKNARIEHKDSLFTCDNLLVRSKGDVHEFTCTGNPVFTDPENKITGDKVLAYSSPRRAEFIGNVKMVSTPKPQVGKGEAKEKITSEPSTTTCDRLHYDYGKKTALATGHVVVKQKLRTVWADQGIYDQATELVTLSGNVRMQNDGEEDMKEMSNAETVTISLQNDWVDVVALPGKQIKIIMNVKEDEGEKK